MVGLMEKDIRLLLKRKEIIIMFLAISFLLGFTTDGNFVIAYLTILCAIFSASTISYDEFDNGYTFLMTLPIDCKTYVAEKYAFCIGSGFIAWIFAVIFFLVTGVVKGDAINLSEDMMMAVVFIPVYIIMLCVMIPIQLKYGGEKSRIVLLVLWGIIALIGFVGAKALAGLNISIDGLVKILDQIPDIALVVIGIAVTILITVISIACSRKIMEKKEY